MKSQIKERRNECCRRERERERILIVDDERGLCALLRKALSVDYEVLVAHSGAKAIEILKKQDPELVIIDNHMPGIDGIETIRRIKETDSRCNFIMMSGLMDIDLFKKAEKLGVRYCFSKPFNLDELKKTIKKIL